MQKRNPKPKTVTGSELADLASVNVRTVQRWTKMGLPRLKNRRYNLKRAWQWKSDFDRDQARSERAPSDIEEAKGRKLNAEADIAEIDLAERRRNTLTVDDHTLIVEEIVQQMSAVVRTIPTRHARDIVGIKTTGAARKRLEEIVNQVLTSLQDVADSIEEAV